MKLYYAPGSCSLAPHIALREAGLAFRLEEMHPKTHTLADGRDFYAINELGYVPLLELENGMILHEGPAIMQFIADQVPEAQLAPANGTMERYVLQEWLNFLTSEIHKGYIPIFYAVAAQQYLSLARSKLMKRFAWLDTQLAGKTYLMGEVFSVADAYLYALTNWGRADWIRSVYNLDVDLNGFAHLAAWHARVHARPAVQQALEAEGLAA